MKEGESEFLDRARECRDYGAAVVVMAFDEVGQADTKERKVEICERAYKLLVADGFPPEEIIFDPNIFAAATGIDDIPRYPLGLLEPFKEIRATFPHFQFSGGLSNPISPFPGNDPGRRPLLSALRPTEHPSE